jgi:hypothetical protein
MSTELSTNDSQITSVTLSYDYSSSSSATPTDIGERLGENAFYLIAYGVGFILNVYLFVVCLHMYRKNYGIIILNQLLINIVYCLSNFAQYLVVPIIFNYNVYFTDYYFVPNPPAWAWFLSKIQQNEHYLRHQTYWMQSNSSGGGRNVEIELRIYRLTILYLLYRILRNVVDDSQSDWVRISYLQCMYIFISNID